MASKAQLENALRNQIMAIIKDALESYYDEGVIPVGSGEFSIPVKDEEGNVKYPKIKVSIPRGTRDGEGGYIPYNAIEAGEEYKFDLECKEQERAIAKANKEADKRRKKKKDDEDE